MMNLGSMKSKMDSASRYLATTGKGALKRIGEGARSIKKLGGQIDAATGGAAGALWEGAKASPKFGKIATGLEKGLDAAEKFSGIGVKAIELGEKAGKVRSVKGAGGVYKEGKGLLKAARS